MNQIDDQKSTVCYLTLDLLEKERYTPEQPSWVFAFRDINA